MKIPSKIKVGGLTYKIELVDGLADCGSTHFSTQTILISKNQTEDRKLSAVVHEGIEAINEIADLNLPHQTIQTLEAFAFQIIKDNF